MVPLTLLMKLQTKLTNFFTYFKDENILVVSEDKSQPPFMLLIVEPSHPKHILISIAVDFPNSISAAAVATEVRGMAPTQITKPFYISKTDGYTYIDDEAFDRWELESIDLDQLDPENKHIH